MFAVVPHLVKPSGLRSSGMMTIWRSSNSVVQFLRARPRLRRLDLGTCPWELVRGLIPELTGLRVLRVRIASLTNYSVDALVRGLPQEMQAIHVACSVSDRLVCLMVSSLPLPLLT